MSGEEYLDSLLSNVQANNNDPKSALSRMSAKGSSAASTSGSDEAMNDLVNNSNGNKDLNEIGNLLNMLDTGEFVDNKMADLLDDIESAATPGIPKFTVGNEPSQLDVRDPEEIALDEAIADAERMDAEIQSGKFSDQSFSDAAESVPSQESEIPVEEIAPTAAKPIVDIDDGDDALMEMAPEVILPEDNIISINKDSDSDAGQTPEEILTDLLDDMQGDSLADPDAGTQDSLSDVLDNIQQDEPLGEGNSADELSSLADLDIKDISPESLEAVMDEGIIPEEEPAPEEVSEPAAEEIPMDDMLGAEALTEEALTEEALTEDALTEEAPAEDAAQEHVTEDQVESLDDIMAGMSELGLDMGEEKAEEAPAEEMPDDIGFTFDGGDPMEASAESSEENPEDAPAEASEETSDEGAGEEGTSEDEEFNLESMEMELNELDAANSKASDSDSDSSLSLDEMTEDFNLNDLEASLDDLLGGDEGGGSAEGEVAEIAGGEEDNSQATEEGSGDVSMPDLDALMNSLASDELEDLEAEANRKDEAAPSEDGEEQDVPKEDILDALTEDGFDDLGAEPSLEDLAALPERAGGTGSDEGPEDDKKGKKKKKGGGLKALLAKLFTALTREDEEVAANGELASLTDENQQVLNELGDEKPKKEKKKKEKKPKKEKPKKEPKPKKEKPPKPKKEKKPKPPKDPGVPEKAISPKKIAISFLFAASLGILVSIPAIVLPERIMAERVQTAFEHKDYTTTYMLLYGKELDEQQQLMYEQSRVIAWAERYVAAHENYDAMNMKEEALDILLMAMRNKKDILDQAAKFNVEIQIESVYSKIESLLLEEYGLTEEDAKAINSIKKDREYTLRLMEIVGTLEPIG